MCGFVEAQYKSIMQLPRADMCRNNNNNLHNFPITNLDY